MSDKTILEQWREIAYNQQADRNQLQRFWANYFNIEKGIYEQLLSNKWYSQGTGRKIRTGCPDYGWFPGWYQ